MKCEMKNVQCCDHLCRSTQYTGAAPIALSPHSKLCRLTHRMFRKTDPELKLLAGAAHRTPSLHRHCCCRTDPSTVKDGNISRHKGRYGQTAVSAPKPLSPHSALCRSTQSSVAAPGNRVHKRLTDQGLPLDGSPCNASFGSSSLKRSCCRACRRALWLDHNWDLMCRSPHGSSVSWSF